MIVGISGLQPEKLQKFLTFFLSFSSLSSTSHVFDGVDSSGDTIFTIISTKLAIINDHSIKTLIN